MDSRGSPEEKLMFADLWFWTTALFAILFVLLAVFHFRNPMPLIQMPELPHHIYFTGHARRTLLADILEYAGHPVFGRFVQGADQVLLRNGTTVLGIREHDNPAAALVIPVKGESVEEVVETAKTWLETGGIKAYPQPVPDTEGLIIRMHVERQLGFDIAFRPAGRIMGKKLGFPEFEKF
jgi:hypothetical protein